MAKEPMPSEDAGPSTAAASEVADSAMAEDAQPLDSPGKHAVSVLWSFGQCLGALLPIYLAGYFGFSLSLVFLCLVVYTGWKHSRDGKKARLQSAMYFSENEQDVTTTRVFRSKREIPAWVRLEEILLVVNYLHLATRSLHLTHMERCRIYHFSSFSSNVNIPLCDVNVC